MSPTLGLLVLCGCTPVQYAAGLRNERFAVLSPCGKYVLYQSRRYSTTQIVWDGNCYWKISEVKGTLKTYLTPYEWEKAGANWDAEIDREFLDSFIDLFGVSL